MNPSKKSKYRLNGMGRIAGHINSSNFITTKLPRTLPNNRIHRDVGLIASSRILIGSMIGTGSAKLLRNHLSPLLWNPAYSIRIMLISDNAMVTFMSFVGGVNPNTPAILAIPMKITVDIR